MSPRAWRSGAGAPASHGARWSALPAVTPPAVDRSPTRRSLATCHATVASDHWTGPLWSRSPPRRRARSSSRVAASRSGSKPSAIASLEESSCFPRRRSGPRVRRQARGGPGNGPDSGRFSRSRATPGRLQPGIGRFGASQIEVAEWRNLRIRADLRWSGREDLNLRPLAPQASALIQAAPRPDRSRDVCGFRRGRRPS